MRTLLNPHCQATEFGLELIVSGSGYQVETA